MTDMDDEIETLMVEVRASTSGFSADIETMRSAIDTSLTDGFSRAGNVLERGLVSAIRRGSLGFDDLKQIALRTMNEIAASALQLGLDKIFGGASSTGNGSGTGTGGLFGSLFGTVLGSVFGLPGRATGGPVSPGRPFLVGERGPELFVPTSAGRVEAGNMAGSGREVRIAINLAAPRGTDSPAMLRRSTRQIASAVRRAMLQS